MSCFVTLRLQFFGAPVIRAEREIKGVTRRYNNSSRRRRHRRAISAATIRRIDSILCSPFPLFFLSSFFFFFHRVHPLLFIRPVLYIGIAVLSSWLINEPAETTLSTRRTSRFRCEFMNKLHKSANRASRRDAQKCDRLLPFPVASVIAIASRGEISQSAKRIYLRRAIPFIR